jgi:hypothetical protein
MLTVPLIMVDCVWFRYHSNFFRWYDFWRGYGWNSCFTELILSMQLVDSRLKQAVGGRSGEHSLSVDRSYWTSIVLFDPLFRIGNFISVEPSFYSNIDLVPLIC